MNIKSWSPGEIVNPGDELDATVARFMGHEVKPLSQWGDEPSYYPAIEDRSMLFRSVWLVSDGDGEVEVPHVAGDDGRWSVRPIERYSTSIDYAWPVYERILEKYDESASIHGKNLYLWADYMGPREIITGVNAAHAICLGAKYIWDRGLRPH